MLKVYNLKKNSLLTISCFIFFLFVTTSHAQKVSNVNYRQEQSSIIVSYDLETKAPCKVSLYVSTNCGTSWQGPLTKMTGDIGNKIGSGSHNITWNVLEEFEELRGDKIMFQVRAFGDDIETVKIGTQEWTKKNLNVSRYRNGDIIPEIKDAKEWAKLTTGAWCYYDNDTKNGKIYGKLYNWYAVNDPRGLAPEGYHIPSYDEWTTLKTFLGDEIAGIKMKSVEGWTSNGNGLNSYGFSGLAGGGRGNDRFLGAGLQSRWWSFTPRYLNTAWHFKLDYENNKLILGFGDNFDGNWVRCIKD
jgi:uncharacterized protein (TIGR02145 family)